MTKLRKNLAEQALAAAVEVAEIAQFDAPAHLYAKCEGLRELVKLLKDDICEENPSEGPYW